MSFRVRVLFFGVLRDVLGRSADEVALHDGATVRDLLARYASDFPRVAALAPTLALSVNQEYSPATTALREGDEVALLPPVSGGTATTQIAAEHCLLTSAPLDAQPLAAALQKPEDGAVVVFDGVVRNHTRDRRTLFLEYEAYAPMAVQQMQALVAEAKQKFAIRDAAIHHRTGRLEIGEASVVIVVCSAHRAAAFDACRWLIDTLKRTVPIWKKEHFEGGAVWADGEPFPDAISQRRHGATEE